MNILKYLRYIYSFGVKQEHTSSEKRDIIFTNQAIFVLMFSSVCIAIANLFAGCYLRMVVPAMSFSGLWLAFYYQTKFEFDKAKFIAIFFPFMAAIISTTVFGPLAKTQFYLGATLVLALILFHERKSHIAIFCIHLLAIPGLQYWILKNQALIPNQDSFYLGVFNLAFISCCIFLTLSQFKVHYHKYESKVNDLLLSVQEKSNEIKITE